MTRHDNDSLFLYLAMALESEHRARTGHPYAIISVPPPICETCQQLQGLFAELEQRNAEAMMQDLDAEEASVHGVDCRKAVHDSRTGYLHGAADDRPYDVDGVRYCGRCHRVL